MFSYAWSFGCHRNTFRCSFCVPPQWEVERSGKFTEKLLTEAVYMVHFNTFPHYRWFPAFFWATCLSSLVFNVSQAIIWWAWFRCSLQEKSNDSFTEQRLLIEPSLLVVCKKWLRYYAEFSACQKRCQVISHSLPLSVCNSVNKLPTKWQFYYLSNWFGKY